MRREWHLLSPFDSLSAKNGSAVLTVARALAGEAVRGGNAPLIIGGQGTEAGLPGAVGLMSQPASGVVAGARTAVERLGRGTSSSDVTAIADLPDEAPDLIVAHNLPWLGAALGRRYPTATRVLYAHNRMMTRVPSTVSRRAVTSFTRVVAVSTFVANDLVSRTGVPRELVTPVVNGVDAETFDVGGERQWDVLFVGRLVPEKGIDVLLDALAICHRAGVPLSLAVVGARWFYGTTEPSPFERRLRRMAAGLGDSVSFLGRVSPVDMPSVLAAAGTAVVPSVWAEPCGLTALEGLASRAALVTSDAGGLPEVVGRGAVVVPRGDPHALATALMRLHHEPSVRSGVAARGQERARTLTWARAYEALGATCRAT